jgi:galactan 5-O-arabinofuranosyltransferase
MVTTAAGHASDGMRVEGELSRSAEPDPALGHSPPARAGRLLGELAATVLVSATASVLVQAAVSRLHVPTGTFIPNAVVVVVGPALVIGLVLLALRGRSGAGALVGAWSLLSALSTAPLALMLQGTHFYLGGTQADQSFRLAFLTRFADSAALRDMTYADVPPYYPAGWFWIGGRLADLLGVPAWEFYKPYAITTVAVVAAVALTAWRAILPRRAALGAAVATLLVGLRLGAYEPYGWAVAALLPPVAVIALRTFGAGPRRPWRSLVGLGTLIGFAALTYTLYAGLAAVVILATAVAARISRRVAGSEAVLRLVASALVALLVSLLHWFPYLLAWTQDDAHPSGAAARFLPLGSTKLPFPMLEPSALGVLSLVGAVWIVASLRHSLIAQALAIVALSSYGWFALSTLALLSDQTLLAFRMEPVIDLVFLVAGVLGVAELLHRLQRAPGRSARDAGRLTAVGAVLAVVVSTSVVQALPADGTAYASYYPTGVTASGERDPNAPGRWNGDLMRTIDALTGRSPSDVVLLTADGEITAFAPYYSFAAATPHYGNPLGDYDERRDLVRSWAASATPRQLLATLDASPYRAPTVFVLGIWPDGLHLPITRDLFPKEPNVTAEDVVFPTGLFTGPEFTTRTVGPFFVAVRR